MEQYINKAALVAEIWRRKQTWQHQDQQYVNGGKDVCDYLLGFIDTLEVEKEPVSNDLEEAADNYVGHAPEIDEDLSCFIRRNAFIAGAQWQKEQMIYKACKWLKSYRQDTYDGTGYVNGIVNDKTIEEFKQAMEE